MIPGNILNRAMRLTGGTQIQWYAATGRTENAIGVDVATYAAPVGIFAQVQPVPRSIFQQMGLDFDKDYIMIYASFPMDNISRDRSADYVVFAGDKYELLSATTWFPINGWNGALAAKIPPAPVTVT